MRQESRREGTSRMRSDGKWYEEKAVVNKLTGNELEITVTSPGYKAKVWALSKDGIHYQGTYEYEKKEYQPGEVQFIRIRENNGKDILQGSWIERGAWTIELHS